jgi:hypothetical protein
VDFLMKLGVSKPPDRLRGGESIRGRRMRIGWSVNSRINEGKANPLLGIEFCGTV